jgi:uncharacterized membrane protein
VISKSGGESSTRLPRGGSALTRVAAAATLGAVAGVLAAFWAPWQLAALMGWDASAIVLTGWTWHIVRDLDGTVTQRIAMRADDSRPVADVILVSSALASLLGVGLALLKASHQSGVAEALTTSVAVLSVAITWLTVHTVFMLRYARLYYENRGGIEFGEGRDPNYRDFAYVAFTIGMTYQVADTELSSKEIRATVLRHALLSFVFGTAVIAVTINVVATLLGR